MANRRLDQNTVKRSADHCVGEMGSMRSVYGRRNRLHTRSVGRWWWLPVGTWKWVLWDQWGGENKLHEINVEKEMGSVRSMGRVKVSSMRSVRRGKYAPWDQWGWKRSFIRSVQMEKWAPWDHGDRNASSRRSVGKKNYVPWDQWGGQRSLIRSVQMKKWPPWDHGKEKTSSMKSVGRGDIGSMISVERRNEIY